MLKSDRPHLGKIGKPRRADDANPIKFDGHVLPFKRDQKDVPLPQGPVRLLDRNASPPHLLRKTAIGAVAVDLARAEFLRPDIGLTCRLAAEQNAAVARIGSW